MPVRAPGLGERRIEILRDLAALTGATLLDDEIGPPITRATIDDLGQAKRIVVTRDSTTLYEGAGSFEAIEARAVHIRAQLSSSGSSYDREKLIERLARLRGKIATILVGAPTEAELDEAQRRFANALAVALRATEHGYLPGGGAPLISAAEALRAIRERNPARARGIQAVIEALEYPLRIIARNAQQDETAILAEIGRYRDARVAYNAHAKRVEDLEAAGILDAADVIIRALEIAASHARILLQTSPDEPLPPVSSEESHDVDGS